MLSTWVRLQYGRGVRAQSSCQDPCGVAPTITNNVCDKRAVATMPLVFEQYVAGAGWQLMFCAPGTAYNHSQCACTDPNPAAFEPPECRAELYIPFNDGEARDESGNNNFVQNDGVKVSGGVGYFDGSAVLRVPRFSNSDYGDVLLVRLRYKQHGGHHVVVAGAGGQRRLPQAQLAVPGRRPPGCPLRDAHQHGAESHVVVPELSVGWKEAVLYIDRQLLTGSVNNFSKQTLFTGSLDSSKCALQIGRGTNFQNFKGLMDDITVYLCRPKTL
ncbi:LOW QUALITY PROTEIN: protein PIF-like [Pomacea canaliculata]|uniref:LOW QUALITY PROTEIN: protein PIF-like n=1 Tax=Pomacea canaliculata TaxID=400727 RepID=UPI000D72FD1C|nr:LOW QUALITY PROTEIN: protein PIF-like [Pomacea canaliculata]